MQRESINNERKITGRPHRYSNENLAAPLQLSGTSSILMFTKAINLITGKITLDVINKVRFTSQTSLEW